MEPPAVQIVRHPAERRRRQVVTIHQGCCCCCCCCLHAVGALVGAVVGPILYREPAITAERARARIAVAAIYWSVLCVQVLLVAIYVLSYYPSDLGAIEASALGLVFCLPMLQFVSTLVVGLITPMFWTGEVEKAAFAQLGKMTSGCFVGAGGGIAIMVFMLAIALVIGALR